jgi:tetratricopeptide (TPR) repeat protein
MPIKTICHNAEWRFHKLFLVALLMMLSDLRLNAQSGISAETRAYEKLKKATSDTARFNALMPLFRHRLNVASDWTGAKTVLDSVKKYALAAGHEPSIIRALSAEGGYNRMIGNWDVALSAYLEALTRSEKLGDDRRRATLCFNIATLYEDQEDETNLRIYLQKSEEYCLKANDLDLLGGIYGNWGKVYARQKDFGRAQDYFQKSLDLNRQMGILDPGSWLDNGLWLAQVLIEQKNYLPAGPVIDTFRLEAQKLESHIHECQFWALQARIKREQGDHAAAVALAEHAARMADKVHNAKVAEIIYKELSDCYSAAGNFSAGLKAQQQVQAMRDSVLSENKQRNMMMAEARYQNAQKELEIKSLTRSRRRGYAVAGVLGLFVLIGGAAYQRKRLRLQDEIRQKRLLADELEKARTMLHEFTQTLIEKNAGAIGRHRSDDIDVDQADLNSLLESTILTGADWERFKYLLDKVHPNFMARLQDSFPNLTNGENRLMAIARIGLPTKEAAAMLGISPESARKARQRLRKKIKLAEHEDLEAFVGGI